jgi:hypothetical protein
MHMKRLLVIALYLFASFAIIFAGSQLMPQRVLGEAGVCCGETSDCTKEGDTCQGPLQGQTLCCDTSQQNCPGGNYCRKKPNAD